MVWRMNKGEKGATAPGAPAPALPRHKRAATDDLPRGLPDGDRNKLSATARWPSSDEMAGFRSTPDGPAFGAWRPGMFLVGRDEQGRYYGVEDDRHVLTVAGSRAGKGISLIVPNLLYWPGSALVIDPKGELATLTASRREGFGSEHAAPMTPGVGKVFALDPFGRVTGPAQRFAHAGFNPMADLDPTTGAGLDLADQLADALIIQSTGDGAHWTQAGKALLRVLILYVAATEAEPASKNLITVRRLVTQSLDGIRRLGADMAKMDPDKYDLIARTGESFQGMRDGELLTIRSGIEAQTAFLEGEEMQRVLSTSDFRLEDLKAERVTVYLCLPATRLATHGRWLRLVVALAMDAMERTGPLKLGQPPVLFCLDEFAALGTMETVEKAAGQIASFGVKLWPIVQDLTQLKRDYKDAWETFMGNAGLLTFFGNTDLTTTEHIAKRLGDTEVVRTVVNGTETWQRSATGPRVDPFAAVVGGAPAANRTDGVNTGGSVAHSQTVQRAPLLNAAEIVQAFARETGKILVLVPNQPPCALHRVRHFGEEDERLFGGLCDPIDGQKPPRVTRGQREAWGEPAR